MVKLLLSNGALKVAAVFPGERVLNADSPEKCQGVERNTSWTACCFWASAVKNKLPIIVNITKG